MTGFGKTLRMGFFQKIEFDAWLISSTIKLTRVQVLGRSRASLWRYSDSTTSLRRRRQQLEEGLFDMYNNDKIWTLTNFDLSYYNRALRESRVDPIWRVFTKSVYIP